MKQEEFLKVVKLRFINKWYIFAWNLFVKYDCY